MRMLPAISIYCVAFLCTHEPSHVLCTLCGCHDGAPSALTKCADLPNTSPHLPAAADCLKKYQFKVIIRGHQAKMMYAADDRDKVYGPYSYKFQIIIDNLSEEVDDQMLRDRFSKYGDILQVKTGYDDWDQVRKLLGGSL